MSGGKTLISKATRIDPGGAMRLDGLGDVTITAPGNNALLAFDTATGEWINQTPAQAGVSAAGHTHNHNSLNNIPVNDHIDWTDASSNFKTSGTVKIDAISERTVAAGVTVDGLLIKDAGIPQAAVTQHEAALAILVSQISDLIVAPIGVIMGWDKTLTNTPALPSGWVECNGQTIVDAGSVYNGVTIRNLNSNNQFLRGATTSGGTGGAATHTLTEAEMPAHTHNLDTATTPVPVSGATVTKVGGKGSTATTSTGGGAAHPNEPQHTNFVMIMRIK